MTTDEIRPYKSLDPAELVSRIEAVRRRMGRELLILGHHYQQDEVIALADLRGDSYQLSALAAADDECRAIAFCGVHFMAETADILANRPEQLARRGGQRVTVVLPDLKAGCSMADMADIDQVEDCWEQLAEVIDVGRGDAGHLRQFGGQPEGLLRPARRDRLHVVQRPGRAGMVVPAAAARALLSRSALGPQHGPEDGHSAWSEMPVWDPRQRELGGNDARGDPRQPRALVEGPLQRPPDVPAAARGASSARSIPASRSSSIPSARWKWSSRPT